MSAQNQPRLSLGQFAARIRGEMIPLGNNQFRYFCAAGNLSDEDIREYLDEPVNALPPTIATRLPQVQILLVPYLELAAAARNAKGMVVAEEPPGKGKGLASGSLMDNGSAVLAFAIKDTEVADYHYRFYNAIADLVAGKGEGENVPEEFIALLRAELKAQAHGEVDEPSWRLKSGLTAMDRRAKLPTRRVSEYARQSFVDTLTLYMHGICCDIDVDTGPRQLPSNHLRKRLQLLRSLYPPPKGYAVFPDEVTE